MADAQNSSFSTRLTGLLGQIYPDLDPHILGSKIVEAFWPDGTRPRKRGRLRGQ